jgi:hypothetical protein
VSDNRRASWRTITDNCGQWIVITCEQTAALVMNGMEEVRVRIP